MNFKPFYLIILVVLIHGQVSAQENTKKVGLSLSYFGEFITHPGFKAGYERELWSKDITRTKRNGKEINARFELLVNGNLYGYFHKRNHIGLMASPELSFRYIRKKGFFYEASTGVGYLHTFLQGDTYEVDDNNNVKRIPLASQANFSYLFSVGIGKDYSFAQGKPWSWKLKWGMFRQSPFGSGYLWHTSIELGVTHYLKFNRKN